MKLDPVSEIGQILVDTERILNDMEFYINIFPEINKFEFVRVKLEELEGVVKIFFGSFSISGIIRSIDETNSKFISPNYIAEITTKNNEYYLKSIQGRQSNYQI